jgi:hypothetical protein
VWPPQVAKLRIAQIAAILGFMLKLSQTRTARSSLRTEWFRVIRFVVLRRSKIGKSVITRLKIKHRRGDTSVGTERTAAQYWATTRRIAETAFAVT